MPDINFYTVYGDNIVEILRFRSAIIGALAESSPTKITDDFDRLDLITEIKTNEKVFRFKFVSGFDCWNPSIISQLVNFGLNLRETPDIILTKETDPKTVIPILALEYCSALQAGNQAWQRAGRGYAFGSLNIPYIYLGVMGGTELDSDRGRKVARHPNPAIAQSFLEFSKRTNGMFLPIYLPAPDFNLSADNKKFEPVLGEALLNLAIRDILFANSVTPTTLSLINNKCLNYKNILANGKRKKASKTWNKKISIPISTTAAKLHEFCKRNGQIIGANELPFCLLEGEEIIDGFYQQMPEPISKLSRAEGLKKMAIVFVAGFKPRGDDSRPDRGLLPFLRMLIGDTTPVLSVIYGPMSDSMFAQFKSSPADLPKQNGLFESLWLGNEIYVCRPDGTNHRITVPGPKINNGQKIEIQSADSITSRPSEHFVDQSVCLLLEKLVKGKVFECMCNPPGGDWSGISIFQDGKEFRWLSLPRVSGISKRPDHLYQVSSNTGADWLLVIESKDLPNKLEHGIGRRLLRYVSELLEYKPSVERKILSGWVESKTKISLKDFRPITLFAFYDNGVAIKQSHTDLVCKVRLDPKPSLTFSACTDLGRQFLIDQLHQ